MRRTFLLIAVALLGLPISGMINHTPSLVMGDDAPVVHITVFETIGVTESNGERSAASVSGTSIGSTLSSPDPADLTVMETIQVSDTQGQSTPLSIDVTESVSVSDSPQAVLPASITVNESISVTDAPQVAPQVAPPVAPPASITVNESIGVIDSYQIAIPGDANGDGYVDAIDITKVERIIAALDTQTPGSDANGDGNVNALDITKVERIIVGLD